MPEGAPAAALPAKALPARPLPLRLASPPLPPRNNASGLPPTYLAHLRSLVHQWLRQQTTTSHGLPGSEDVPLWTEDETVRLERAIWSGAIAPPADRNARGLLKLDWVTYAAGSARRREAYTRQSQENESSSDVTALKTADAHLAVPSTPLLSPTPTGTPRPAKSSRTASIASSSRSVSGDGPEVALPPDAERYRSQSAWSNAVRKLKGFEAMRLRKRDEWDVVEADSRHHNVPGAFPQSSHCDHAEPSVNPNQTAFEQSRLPVDCLLKPVFTVHFEAAPARHQAEASSTTLRMQREGSSGAGSTGSMGSLAGKRWWQHASSGPRFSDLTATADAEVEVNFVKGKFALLSSDERPRGRRISGSDRVDVATASQRDGHDDNRGHESEDTEAASTESDGGSGEDDESTWSRTQRSVPSARKPVTVVVAGMAEDIPADADVHVVGGTLIIRGVHQEEERLALERLFRVLVSLARVLQYSCQLYTIQSMFVELELLDGFRIPREPDPPPPIAKPARTSDTPRSSVDVQRRSSQKNSDRRVKGLFSRFSRESRGVLDGLFGRVRRGSESDTLRSAALARTETAPATSTATHFPTIQSETFLAPSIMSTAAVPTPLGTDRHLQTLERLERLVPSPSPGVKIPMPPILLRVREEDRVRRDKAQAETDDIEGLPPSGTATPRIVSNPATPLLPEGSARGDVHGRALGYRLGGDVRTGLGVLYTAPEDFDGWVRLQKLDTLYATGIKDEVGHNTLCDPPIAQSYVFWDSTHDVSIGAYLKQLARELAAPSACGREGCGAANSDHMRWWLHGAQRVGLQASATDDESVDGIDAWMECSECGATTAPRDLSEVAATFSWGKLLELLLYSRDLMRSDVCRHASDDRAAVVVRFRTAAIVASLAVSPLSVLNTRLPKLQVGPNVHKRKPGKGPALLALDAVMRREAKEAAVENFKREIECFFLSIDQRLALLVGATSTTVDKSIDAIGNPAPSLLPENSQELDDASRGAADPSIANLALAIHQRELDVYELLATTPVAQLNNCRRNLTQAIRDCEADCQAWLVSHNIAESFDAVPLALPDYATDSKVHALPGSAVLVRENEPSSLIAYTLSSLAYFTELTRAPTDEPGNFDADGVTVEVKRRNTPRDLLSLRTLAKKKSDGTVSLSAASKAPLALSTPTPTTSIVEVTHEQAEGKSQPSDSLGDLVRNIAKAAGQEAILTAKASRSSSVSDSESGLATFARTPRAHPVTLSRRTGAGDAAPPSAFRPARTVSSTSIPPFDADGGGGSSKENEGWSSVTSTFTSGFQHLVKLGADVTDSIGSFKMRPGDRSLTSLIGPLSIMSSMDNALTSTAAFDDRPHLQFSYTVGDKVRFGCTVYHATAFDSLRRRCAVDKSVISSLARANVWDAQGGKSKASFFMTQDQKYIVKELVSKWNVSDTHALLEIAPAYFSHLANTHNRATSLAKIVGFYTIRIHDLQTSTKRQLDLLVMENLFYDQSVSQTYDLKGIEGRKVPKVSAGSTLFDGEWLEGQARNPILLYPHARRILTEAVSIDTRFLSTQSIMDYSLLLGLDDARGEVVAGLVDAIGSFNLFKTLESRGKLALNRGGDVTIYRERFENAIKQYFVACPDKWSKNARAVQCTIAQLPSVL